MNSFKRQMICGKCKNYKQYFKLWLKCIQIQMETLNICQKEEEEKTNKMVFGIACEQDKENSH